MTGFWEDVGVKESLLNRYEEQNSFGLPLELISG
jgi:hypothetical protein